MALKPIKIDEFKGMNNVDRTGVRVVLNMDATPDHQLVVRRGFSLSQAFTDPHSLKNTGSEFLLAAQGATALEALWSWVPGKTPVEIGPISGKGFPLSYVVLSDKVFISSKAWARVYENGSLRAWGQYLRSDPAELVDAPDSSERLALNVIPAPCMENLCLAGSRIFGSVGKKVYYSDPPFAYEMFRPDAFLEFPEEIVMIAKVPGGMLFSSVSSTWYASGYEPSEMQFEKVLDGALPGSLAYLTTFRGVSNVPIWTGQSGVYVGVGSRPVPMTDEKLKFDASGQGAACVTEWNGSQQYITTFPLSATVTRGDAAAVKIFKDGRLPKSFDLAMSPDASFSDAASCEVYRNGVPI